MAAQEARMRYGHLPIVIVDLSSPIKKPLTLPRQHGRSTRKIVLSSEERAYMHQEYALSLSLDAVGVQMGINANTIKRELRRDGVKTRTGKEYLSRLSELEFDYVHSDLDVKEMVVKYNVGKNSLFRLFREKGWERLVWKRRYFREVWGRNMSQDEIEKKMREVTDRMSIKSSGANNPMYGKPSPQGAGNGWKGWYRDHYFRSLREVAFMIRMDAESKGWKSGESISIPYTFEGKERTYHPDFVIGDTIYEIKPTRLHQTPNIKAKTTAALYYCAEAGLKYVLADEPLKSHKIARALMDGRIEFSQNYRRKFIEYMTQNLRELATKAMQE